MWRGTEFPTSGQTWGHEANDKVGREEGVATLEKRVNIRPPDIRIHFFFKWGLRGILKKASKCASSRGVKITDILHAGINPFYRKGEWGVPRPRPPFRNGARCLVSPH